MIESANIGVVILAAGSSSRLGRPKQLVMFNNRPLLQHIIEVVKPFNLTPAVMVLGAHVGQILEGIDPGDISVSMNKNWDEGIASSIRAGVAESKKLNDSLEHLLFLLSDQPFVTADLIEELIQKHVVENQQITACRYKENVGVPAIFHKEFFPQLLKLRGDVGAKKIIAGNRNIVSSVVFRDGAFDVDTEEDYKELTDRVK
ncbi:MAG: nucleotidyltransferase family protein [Balneolaceae bacterium]